MTVSQHFGYHLIIYYLQCFYFIYQLIKYFSNNFLYDIICHFKNVVSACKNKLQLERRKIMTTELTFNGVTIHSLKELRDNFNSEELLKYHMDGSLLSWLEQHYYENEAIAINQIPFDKPGCINKLCKALGLECEPVENMTEEEKEKLNRKRIIVSEFTSDSDVLNNLHIVALNQEELAALLNNDAKKIYLCNESFSIPIRKPNVEYINAGNASIDNPYTKTQYEKAGITVSGFELPMVENESTIEIAKQAAISNGYDDFHETHSPLATLFHKELKSRKIINVHHLYFDSSLSGKSFKSKHECEAARDKCIEKAYNEANKFFDSSSSKSLAKEAADFYRGYIDDVFSESMKNLETICSLTGYTKQYEMLNDKIKNCYKNLLTDFQTELIENGDYYSMYDLDYFIDQTDIEEYDCRVSDGLFFRTFEKLVTDSVTYSVCNLFTSVNELENDLAEHANTFYGYAFNSYKAYVDSIEEILDSIGKDLPKMDDDETVESYLTKCCVQKAC